MNPKINKNSHNIFLAIFLPSKWMPRSNKLICTKNPTNPRNFANPEIKLANLKIPPTKHTHQKKKKEGQTQTQILLTKRKKHKPNRLWVCNGWGVAHGGCGDFHDCWEFQLVSEVFDAWLWLGLSVRIFLVAWGRACMALDHLSWDLRVRVETGNWVRVRCERDGYWSEVRMRVRVRIRYKVIYIVRFFGNLS